MLKLEKFGALLMLSRKGLADLDQQGSRGRRIRRMRLYVKRRRITEADQGTELRLMLVFGGLIPGRGRHIVAPLTGDAGEGKHTPEDRLPALAGHPGMEGRWQDNLARDTAPGIIRATLEDTPINGTV
jgi:hypothetical protein